MKSWSSAGSSNSLGFLSFNNLARYGNTISGFVNNWGVADGSTGFVSSLFAPSCFCNFSFKREWSIKKCHKKNVMSNIWFVEISRKHKQTYFIAAPDFLQFIAQNLLASEFSITTMNASPLAWILYINNWMNGLTLLFNVWILSRHGVMSHFLIIYMRVTDNMYHNNFIKLDNIWLKPGSFLLNTKMLFSIKKY